MKLLRFSIRSLFAITFVCALTVFLWPKPDPNAPDPKWRELLFKNSAPLLNAPEITVDSVQDDWVRVAARNTGSTTLQYRSAGKSLVQLFQETHDGKQWTTGTWDWCGTGKQRFEIAPDETVELELHFWSEDKPVRMLAAFSEKNTDRRGLVVLASQETVK